MESTANRKLYKSRTDRLIDGVCAGVADYFGWDVTIVRVAWLSTVFFGGTGIAAYIAAMILLPVETIPDASAPEVMARAERRKLNQGLFIGVTLILVGIVFLLDELHILSRHWFWFHFPWDFVVPSLFIIAGIVLIVWPIGRSRAESELHRVSDMGSMRRDTAHKKIFGVCAGLAHHLGLDPSIVRILWVVGTFISFPLGVFVYLLMGLLIPDGTGRRIFDSKTASNQS